MEFPERGKFPIRHSFEAEKFSGVKGIFWKSRNLFKFFEVSTSLKLFLADGTSFISR